MLICIDAGHGRNTAGKRCLKRIDPGETREWTLNSRIADKLQALLAGYNCQTMRADDVTGDRDVPLADRCEAANAARADVYVSIHHNAGINGGSGGGIVVYIHPNHQKQSEVVQEAVYRHLIAQTGLKGNRDNPLAEANHQVTRETEMPAILCECGFMDSTHDTPIILTEEFADQAARGLRDALAEVYGLKPSGGTEEPEDPGYEQWKAYMARYRAELAGQAAAMPELLEEAVSMGLTDGSRPRDLMTREEGAVMARAAAMRAQDVKE